MHRPLTAAPTVPVIWACLLVCALALVPLATVPVPPLLDYPNHLARLHVIATIGSDPLLAAFYRIDWQLIPNLALDLLLPPVAALIGVDAAGRIFLAAKTILMITGPVAVHRALFGYWSIAPLIGAVIAYNGVTKFGFLNYELGIGLAVWSTAAVIALRRRGPMLRLGVTAALALLLFTCHLLVLGLFGLACLVLTAVTLLRDRPAPRIWLREAVVLGLPFLPPLLLLLASPTAGLSGNILWSAAGKLQGLLNVFSVGADITDLVIVNIALAAIVLAAQHGVLRVHPAGVWLFLAGQLIYFAMPRALFGSWEADQRFPLALAFLLIGFISLDLARRPVRAAFIGVLAVLLSLRVAQVHATWNATAAVIVPIRAALAELPRGARLLVTAADDRAGPFAIAYLIDHVPSYATIDRSALVTRLFTVPGKQVLTVRPPYAAIVDSGDWSTPQVGTVVNGTTTWAEAYWLDWRNSYDHIIVLDTRPNAPNPAPEALSLLRSGRMFQLYRIMR